MAFAIPAAAWAGVVVLNPDHGPEGTSVTAVGSGYPAGHNISVLGWGHAESNPLATAVADTNGAFQTSFTVPAGAGTTQLQFWDVEGRTFDVAPFTVTINAPQPMRHPPVITSIDLTTEGQLVYLNVHYTDPDNNASGFGFRGANGSGWGQEAHPFSAPGYGRISPGLVSYPFNHSCGTPSQYESDVEFWITDDSGLQSTSVTTHIKCVAGANVPDTTRPVISNVPSASTATAQDANGAAINYASPTATDNVDGSVSVSCSPPSGSHFAIATTTVTCTAKDKAGNSASATFTVTVQPAAGTTPPGVSNLRLVPNTAGTQVELTWDAVKDADLDHYVVERAGDKYVEIGRPTKPTLADKDLAHDTVYYYRVSAVDHDGNRGEAAYATIVLHPPSSGQQNTPVGGGKNPIGPANTGSSNTSTGGVTNWQCDATACTWALSHDDTMKLEAAVGVAGAILPQSVTTLCIATLPASIATTFGTATVACAVLVVLLRIPVAVLPASLLSNDQGNGVLLTGISCDLRNFTINPQPPGYASVSSTRSTRATGRPGLVSAFADCASAAGHMAIPGVLDLNNGVLGVPILAPFSGVLHWSLFSKRRHGSIRVHQGVSVLRLPVGRRFRPGRHQLIVRIHSRSRDRTYQRMITVRRGRSH
jgi:hypothetical protein